VKDAAGEAKEQLVVASSGGSASASLDMPRDASSYEVTAEWTKDDVTHTLKRTVEAKPASSAASVR
jgi:hypothetical protein